MLKKAKGKGFEYIAGERRFLAAKKAKLKTIPCIVRDLGDIEAAETSIYENIQREDMSAFEQDKALRKLVELKKQKMEIEGTKEPSDDNDHTVVEEVARDAKVSPKTVERAIATENLIKEARAAYKDGDITKRQAVLLSNMDKEKQDEELPKMIEETQKATDSRHLVEKAAPSKTGERSQIKAALRMFDMVVARSHELATLSDELRNSLTDDVVLELRGSDSSSISACHDSLKRLLEDISSVVDWQNRGRR